MPVISGGTSLFAPTLLPGAISVTLPFLSASSVLYAPVLTFVWNDVDNPSSPIWANVDSVTTPSYGDVDSPTTPTWEDVD